MLKVRTRRHSRLLIGVTGSFGSGKTTVAEMFRRQGAAVIDADAIVHDLLKRHAGCRKAICRVFGPGVASGSKGVDRVKLARIVFADRKALRKLEAILHPLAWQETRKAYAAIRGRFLVVLDAPLLLEAGWQKRVDAVLVVKAGLRQQVERIRRRTGLRKADVLRRIHRQMPFKDKLKHADFVVDNSGPKTDTYKQIKAIIGQLRNLINHEE